MKQCQHTAHQPLLQALPGSMLTCEGLSVGGAGFSVASEAVALLALPGSAGLPARVYACFAPHNCWPRKPTSYPLRAGLCCRCIESGSQSLITKTALVHLRVALKELQASLRGSERPGLSKVLCPGQRPAWLSCPSLPATPLRS